MIAQGAGHDPHLKLTRFCLGMTELMRMVPGRLPGTLWFTAQEFHQAANAAPRSPIDRRKTAFGQVATTAWLNLMVKCRVLVHDLGAGRYWVLGFERTHRRAFAKAADRHRRHNEANRLRYHIERDHSAPEDTRDAWCDLLAADAVSGKRGDQIGRDMACEAHLGLSPDIYNSSGSSNYSAEHKFKNPQLPAPQLDQALAAAPTERDLAHALLLKTCAAAAKIWPTPDALEPCEVADVTDWRRRHGEDPKAAEVLLRRTLKRRRNRASQPAAPRPPRQQGPFPICSAPLRAKPLQALMAERQEHSDLADRPGLRRKTRAHHQARLVAIETLIGALREAPATRGALHKFWSGRRWLGTLGPTPAKLRGASLGLLTYIADRMEADGSSLAPGNPAGILIHRAGLWLAAQKAYEVRHA